MLVQILKSGLDPNSIAGGVGSRLLDPPGDPKTPVLGPTEDALSHLPPSSMDEDTALADILFPSFLNSSLTRKRLDGGQHSFLPRLWSEL